MTPWAPQRHKSPVFKFRTMSMPSVMPFVLMKMSWVDCRKFIVCHSGGSANCCDLCYVKKGFSGELCKPASGPSLDGGSWEKLGYLGSLCLVILWFLISLIPVRRGLVRDKSAPQGPYDSNAVLEKLCHLIATMVEDREKEKKSQCCSTTTHVCYL